MSTMCTTLQIYSIPSDLRCQYVSDNCDFSYFNFFSLHYCLFNENYFITLPVLVILLLFCFYLLSNTGDKYLSIALTKLTHCLQLSPNISAMTLLALGNGAPDIITSIVASESQENGGVEFAVGIAVGSGMFITCIILSSVLLFVKEVKTDKNAYLRNIIIYLIALGSLLYFSLKQKINVYEAVIFSVLYVM